MTNPIEKYTADHLAIRQLIDQYNDVINHREWDKLSCLFAEDAIWTATNPMNLQFAGLEHIQMEIPKSVGRTEVLIQSASGIVVQILDAKNATARSQLNEFGRRIEDLGGFHVIGTFLDKFKKIRGAWKFSRREFSLSYADELPVLGHLYK